MALCFLDVKPRDRGTSISNGWPSAAGIEKWYVKQGDIRFVGFNAHIHDRRKGRICASGFCFITGTPRVAPWYRSRALFARLAPVNFSGRVWGAVTHRCTDLARTASGREIRRWIRVIDRSLTGQQCMQPPGFILSVPMTAAVKNSDCSPNGSESGPPPPSRLHSDTARYIFARVRHRRDTSPLQNAFHATRSGSAVPDYISEGDPQ